MQIQSRKTQRVYLITLAIILHGWETSQGHTNSASPMPNLCYSSPFSTTKPTCEAAKVESGKGNMRMKRVTQASSVSGLVHAQMRYHHVKFLIERDKNMERENALLEEKEEAKQSERTTLLDMLETKSLLHMQKANVNLHRLLLSRRDGT